MARIKRLDPEVRKEQILATGAEIARGSHFRAVSRKAVAERVGVSPPLVSRYFPSRQDLARAIYEYAIDREIVEIVAQKLPPPAPLPPVLEKKLKKYLARVLD